MRKLHLLALIAISAWGGFGALAACTSETVVTNDAGTDAGTQDVVQPTVDVVDPPKDAGAEDVLTDAGLKLESYAETVATAMCNALARCCFGNASLDAGDPIDGGTFDRAECQGLYKLLGFESSNVGLAITQENVVLNQAKGAECLAKIDALACNLDGPSLKQIRAACFEALQGQLPNGAPCRTSLECQDGHFCMPFGSDAGSEDAGPDAGSEDAGPDASPAPTGFCTPLRKEGENCSVIDTGDPNVDSIASEIACSQRGGGDTGLRCDSYDFDAGGWRPRSEWTCQKTVPNGAGCNTTVWCSEGICDPGDELEKYICEPMLVYFNKFACQAHVNH
jgi:hypothetical protein